MIRVKICGITSVSDARAAQEAGADALGFVFAKSPRRVTVEVVRRIVREVGPWISTVGVFVDEAPKEILKIARECGLTVVQLHGKESAEEFKKFQGIKVIKALHVNELLSAKVVKKYDAADAFLFDTKIGDQVGGTGRMFEWKYLKKLSIEKPFIVSGGLDPQNVAEAVRFFRPYGVDVSSGVEKSPGKKDLKLVKEFIQNARKA